MSAQMLEVSLLGGVGTVLRLERGAWSMVKRLKGKQQMSTPVYGGMHRRAIPWPVHTMKHVFNFNDFGTSLHLYRRTRSETHRTQQPYSSNGDHHRARKTYP